MNRISFLTRGYAFKGLLAVINNYCMPFSNDEGQASSKFT